MTAAQLRVWPVCRAAALCLAQALLKWPLPKALAPASDCSPVGLMDGGSPPHLKETLLAWLLMTDQSEEMGESSHPHPILCRLALSTLLLHLLLRLPEGGCGCLGG